MTLSKIEKEHYEKRYEKEIKRLRKQYEQDPTYMKKMLNEETYKRVVEGAKVEEKNINRYMITVKEDNTRQYYVDGTSENHAIANYHQGLEDGVENVSNGNDDCMEIIVAVEKILTNVKRDKEGKVINSDEDKKENPPTALNHWRCWWGKKDKDFKKLIRFNNKEKK